MANQGRLQIRVSLERGNSLDEPVHTGHAACMENETLSARLMLKLTPTEKRAWAAVAGLVSIEEGRPVNLSEIIRESVNERAAIVLTHAVRTGQLKGPGLKAVRDYLERFK